MPKGTERVVVWKAETRRYWRAMTDNPHWKAPRTEKNFSRLARGQAPGMFLSLRHVTSGLVVRRWVSVELHHIFPIRFDRPMSEQCFIELWPWEHAAVDPCRHFPYLPIGEKK
jgi:hypothetical protein